MRQVYYCSRNHVDPPKAALRDLKSLVSRAGAASDIEELLGIEGNAARVYFGEFSGDVEGGRSW